MSPVDTWDVSTLLPNMRAYLASLGIVRAPADNGTLPPLWLDRWKGIPYPGQVQDIGPGESHKDLVLGAYPETGIPSAPFEGFYRQKAVTIYIRGRTSPLVQTLYENQLMPALHDKRNYDMNGLQINQSLLFRDLQRLGADENGYVYNCEFMFDLFGPNGSII